jgi:hypothetical protein
LGQISGLTLEVTCWIFTEQVLDVMLEKVPKVEEFAKVSRKKDIAEEIPVFEICVF